MSKRVDRIVSDQFAGPEPTFANGHTLTNSELSGALNWYNYMYAGDDAKVVAFFLDFFKGDKENSAKIKSIKKLYKVRTYAWVARILTRGSSVEPAVMDRFWNAINDACENGLDVTSVASAPSVASVVITQTGKASVQDKTQRKAERIISDMDITIGSEKSVYEFLTHNKVPATYGAKVASYFSDRLSELKTDIEEVSVDPRTAKGFKEYKKNLVEEYRKYTAVMADISRYFDNQKVVRKPRKKKAIPIEKKLKNFKYLEKNDDMKLVSVNPVKIVGAKEIFTYDTKNKKLSKIVANGPSGLDIKGSSIINVDEDASLSKRCGRKTNEVLTNVVDGGKVTLRKVFDNISSGTITFNSRINANTLILRVVS